MKTFGLLNSVTIVAILSICTMSVDSLLTGTLSNVEIQPKRLMNTLGSIFIQYRKPDTFDPFQTIQKKSAVIYSKLDS